MVGTPFVVGSLSNAWFAQHGPILQGKVVEVIDADKDRALVELMHKGDSGTWTSIVNPKTQAPARAPMIISERESAKDGDGQTFELVGGRSIAATYTKGDADKIIPSFIVAALPKWFGVIFFLALLAAAMSTMSSQFHTIGTAAGRDLYERIADKGRSREPSILVMRLAILVGLVVAVTISYTIRQEYVVARFTAIFFGLCAASFLPAYIGGLFSRRVTRAGALASMAVGMSVSLFWLAFIKAREASAIGLVQLVTGGKTSLLADYPNWPAVDPIIIALPASLLTLILVSAVTRPPDKAHLRRCFPD
jgi:SSS family solute:Na+ symporter